jgi:hypothetical protein
MTEIRSDAQRLSLKPKAYGRSPDTRLANAATDPRRYNRDQDNNATTRASRHSTPWLSVCNGESPLATPLDAQTLQQGSRKSTSRHGGSDPPRPLARSWGSPTKRDERRAIPDTPGGTLRDPRSLVPTAHPVRLPSSDNCPPNPSASVCGLSPGTSSAQAGLFRPVSYYAFFKGWLLLSQPPGCLGLPTSFPT